MLQLWKEDGAPEGRSEEYWHRARRLIEQELWLAGAGRPTMLHQRKDRR